MVYRYKALKRNGKRIDEHRWLMQNQLGRRLNRYEVVHHKNGNKQDNRIENLEIQSLKEHSSNFMKRYTNLPEIKKRLIKQGEKGGKTRARNLMKKKFKNGKYLCSECGLFLEKEKFSKNKTKMTGLQSWCKECSLKKRNKKAGFV